jgi:hypothetical protein
VRRSPRDERSPTASNYAYGFTVRLAVLVKPL